MTACERVSGELVRVMYGEADAASMSPELAAHLSGCERCAAGLRETRGLLDELETALRPPAASESALRRIRAALDSRPRSIPIAGAARKFAILRPVWSMAAAALLLLAWRASVWPVAEISTPAPVVLNTAESAAVAEALAMLYVEDSSDVRLEYAAERIDSLREQLGESGRALPWTADDDWDLPRPTSG
ncbi:MAG: hypothetical protein JNG88_03700 [Phycisphaerales bacterium]|nr:hypothetical protein [Phycisphaerales bacterium]